MFSILIGIVMKKVFKENEFKIDKTQKFINNWKATKKPTPFQGTLKIRSNKTFEYIAGACTSKSFSEGNWEIENDTIILNSLKPKKCYYLWDFEFNCEKLPKKGETFIIKKSIKNCNPNSEEDYVIFENAKFYIKDTILIFNPKMKNNCPTEFGEYNNNFILMKKEESVTK